MFITTLIFIHRYHKYQENYWHTALSKLWAAIVTVWLNPTRFRLFPNYNEEGNRRSYKVGKWKIPKPPALELFATTIQRISEMAIQSLKQHPPKKSSGAGEDATDM